MDERFGRGGSSEVTFFRRSRARARARPVKGTIQTGSRDRSEKKKKNILTNETWRNDGLRWWGNV